jgi:hypothetical protein
MINSSDLMTLSQIAKRSGVDLNLLRVVKDNIIGFPKAANPVNSLNRRYYDQAIIIAYLDSGEFYPAYKSATVAYAYKKPKKTPIESSQKKQLELDLALANQFLRRPIIR